MIMSGGLYQKLKNTSTFKELNYESDNIKVKHWLNTYHTNAKLGYSKMYEYTDSTIIIESALGDIVSVLNTSASIILDVAALILVTPPLLVYCFIFDMKPTFRIKSDHLNHRKIVIRKTNSYIFQKNNYIYFSDCQIQKIIDEKCDHIEFIKFINRFDIKSLYNCPHLLGKNFEVEYECIRGINEYYDCSKSREHLIFENRDYIRCNPYNEEDTLYNYNKLMEIEYKRLCVLVKYDIPANSSVLLSNDFKDFCIKSENNELIENYMKKHNYDWNGNNNFGVFNNEYCSSNSLDRFEIPPGMCKPPMNISNWLIDDI